MRRSCPEPVRSARDHQPRARGDRLATTRQVPVRMRTSRPLRDVLIALFETVLVALFEAVLVALFEEVRDVQLVRGERGLLGAAARDGGRERVLVLLGPGQRAE